MFGRKLVSDASSRRDVSLPQSDYLTMHLIHEVHQMILTEGLKITLIYLCEMPHVIV